MHASLPKFIDARVAAAREDTVEGGYRVAELPRASAIATGGDVAFRLRLLRGAKGRPRLVGEVEARLEMQCQRCLEPMTVDLQAPFEVLAVDDEAAAAELMAEHESVVLTDGRLEVRRFVEDELLLAVPDAPRHVPGECSADDARNEVLRQSQESGEAPALETRRPFAQLAEMLGRDPN